MDAAQRAFDLLTRAPAPLAFDCRTIAGLDPHLRFIGLDELRDLLLATDPDDDLGDADKDSGREVGGVGEPGMPQRPRFQARHVRARSAAARLQISDAVWRELVTRARRDGPAWVVAAVGVALPGLRRRVRLLSRGWHGEIADLESEMLLGFLERLRSVDIDDVRICSRLVAAGARAVVRARTYEEDNDAARNGVPHSVPPIRPWDHPELILCRAIDAAIITARDAAVIARTRVGDETLVAIAAELDISVDAVASWRRRAEAKLTQAIHAGDL